MPLLSKLSPSQTAGFKAVFPENSPCHQKCLDCDSGRQLDISPSDHDHRFVAGAKFFNHEHLGALREGGEVSLFSKNHFGLLAATIVSSAVYAMLRYCVRPALPSSLGLHFNEPPFGPFCLITLPTSLGFFFGTLSDSLPIANYRRKSYMIIGASIAAIALLGLTILSTTVNARTLSSAHAAAHLMYVYLTLIRICAAGIVLLKVATEARVVEFSQREPLRTRGSILTNYLLIRTLVECICVWITAAILSYNATTHDYSTRFHSTWVYGALCIICLAALPTIIYRMEEDTMQGNRCDNRLSELAPIAIRGRQMKRFFRMCHQKAVWQVAFFLAFAVATTRFNFSNASGVIENLVNLNRSAEVYGVAGPLMVKFAVMLAWRVWWMNKSWRRFVLCGFLFAASADLIRNLLVLYVGATRSELMYYPFQTLTWIPDAILSILTMVTAVELAELGLEGATSGLFSASRSIISTTMRTLCRKMNTDVYFLEAVSPQSIAKVTLLVCIATCINGLSCVAIPLLPQQKLDAQQLRAFGGYTRSAPAVLYLTIFATFFVALSLTIEVVHKLVNDAIASQ